MADTRITDAEIAGYMGWRGPGAYTEASLRKIREIIDHVLRAERAAASETKNQELRDVFDLAWNQALSDAAFYVEGHCVDGAQHVEHILESAKPKVTVGGLVLASRPAEVDDASAKAGGQVGVAQAETRMDTGFQQVVAPTPEVDEEGLPPLPAPWPNSFPYSYTAEQYRQGQRDAVAADRARRVVGGKIPRESNDALIKLAKYWKLDGDWMTCRGCRRSLIASRDGEELNHGDGCKFWDQQHPWAQLRELVARRPAPAEGNQ